jgi:hypothetical protein
VDGGRDVTVQRALIAPGGERLDPELIADPLQVKAGHLRIHLVLQVAGAGAGAK